MWEYLSRPSAAARKDFLGSVLGQIVHYTVADSADPLRRAYVNVPADLIDSLPRPEWHEHREIIWHSGPRAVYEITSLVLNEHSGVECRPSMLANVSTEDVGKALRRGLVSLDATIARTLKKYAMGPQYDVAMELKSECEEYKDIVGYLSSSDEESSRTTMIMIFCHVMDNISQSTSRGRGLAEVLKGPPDRFPM